MRIRNRQTADKGMSGQAERLLQGLLLGLLLLILTLASGCSDEDCVTCLDDTPPAVPTGVYSVTGDGRVTIIWDDLYYESLAELDHYNVYYSMDPITTCELPEANIMASIEVQIEDSDGYYYYDDYDVDNGVTYYYAVSAVDANGNESCVSFADVFDTPRPEGYDVQLNDHNVDSAHSGFDFSDLTNDRINGNSAVSDIRVEFIAGVPFVRAGSADVFLQDFGSVVDSDWYVRLDWVNWAPVSGYSQTGLLELVLGHAYIVKINDDVTPGIVNYAKFSVTDVDAGGNWVRIDWAYQPVDDLQELKAVAGPGDVAEHVSAPMEF